MQKILISLFTLCGVCCSNAQTVSTSQLIGTKWKEVSPASLSEVRTAVWTFEKDSIVIDLHYKDDNLHKRYKEAYYVSDSAPSSFSNSSVGKMRSGSYIVVYNNFAGMDYSKVKKFNKNEKVMILHYGINYNNVGGMGNFDCQFKLIK